MKLHVPDMTCGHCKAAIEKTIAALDSASKVDVNLENHTVHINGNIGDAAILEALEKEGYPAKIIN